MPNGISTKTASDFRGLFPFVCCQARTEKAETLPLGTSEMPKNGVSVSFDVTALFRSATETQSNQRKELSHSIQKMLLALLKMALTALLKALLNIAAKALLEKLF